MFSVGMVSDVSVTYWSISVHNSNPRNCSVSKQRFDHNFNTVTSLMEADLHIQDQADFRVSESDEELSFFNNLQTGVGAQFG